MSGSPIRRTSCARAIIASTLAAAGAVHAASAATTTGRYAADNFFGVYSGTVHAVTAYYSNGVGPGASYSISFNTTAADNYIYVAVWSDDAVQQGFLADITVNGMRLKTGDTIWQVYATGIDKDLLTQTPTIAEMNAAIALANTASGTAGSSVGWRIPTIGGPNNGTFPPSFPWFSLPGIGADARWIWYDSGLGGTGGTVPFTPGFNHQEFLIFRAPLCAGAPCPGDLNGDGIVNGADLALLLGRWGPCPTGGPDPTK